MIAVRAYVDAGNGSLVPVVGLALAIVVAAVVPIWIAYGRHTSNRRAVLLVALLTSWTCVGWVAAIVLAAVGKPEGSTDD